MTWDPAIAALLAQCPREGLRWAALGYRAGLVDGRAAVMAEIAEAGHDVALAARPILRQPSLAELQRRRGG